MQCCIARLMNIMTLAKTVNLVLCWMCSHTKLWMKREKVPSVVKQMILFSLKRFDECLDLSKCGINNNKLYDQNSCDFKLNDIFFLMHQIHTHTHCIFVLSGFILCLRAAVVMWLTFRLILIYSMIDHSKKCWLWPPVGSKQVQYFVLRATCKIVNAVVVSVNFNV